tara:strand:+ start:25 stop:264 length:240 start_codon:yes stop_codon:yes gene_type:complete
MQARRIVFKFKNVRRLRLINDNNIKIKKISFLFIKFDAYGLFFVLKTLVSKSLSKKSLITHPIVLLVITPTRKIKLIKL